MVAQRKTSETELMLQRCGVTPATLTAAEQVALDQSGFVILTDVMDGDWLRRLRQAFEKVAEQSGQPAASFERQPTGTRHLNDLPWQDAAFAEACTQPRVLAAVYHVLQQPFRISQLTGRDPLPGYGQQGLHTDWLPRTPAEPFYAVTALWLLDDFTVDNGATRLIPGSHHWLKPLPKSQLTPEAHHAHEQVVRAQAGSVLVFNGHLYHSGTRNQSQHSRRVLQCPFVVREVGMLNKSYLSQPAWLTPLELYWLAAQPDSPS